jgi:hypothetical protein
MAERQATVRLDVKGDGFRRGIKQAEGEVAKSAKTMGSALSSALSDGVKGGLSAVQGMLSKIKSGLASLSGIAGGIGFAGLVKTAIDAETQFRRLGYTLKAVAGAEGAASIDKVKIKIKEMANASGKSTEEVTAAFENLLGKSGDLDFTSKAMQAVADASDYTGSSMDSLVDIADGLNGAFGMTGDQAANALAHVARMSKGSGVSVEEFGQKLEMVGATAVQAGMAGEQGFKNTTALLAMAADKAGGMKKGFTGLQGMLDALATQAGRKGVLGKVGITAESKDALEAIRALIKKTGGDRQKLEAALGEKEGKLLSAMAQGGLTEFNAALDAAAKKTMTAAELRAAVNVDDPAKNINRALNMLKDAFQKPEMMSAVAKLAEALPPLADAVGKALEFITKNPLTAGAGLLATTFAKGGLEAMLLSAFSKGGDDAAGKIAGGMSKGAGVFSGSFGIAAALAAASIGAAIEQGSKLWKEWKEHGEEQKGRQKDLLENAEKQGKKRVVLEQHERDKASATTAQDLFPKLFGLTGREIIERDREGNVRSRRETIAERELAEAGPMTVAMSSSDQEAMRLQGAVADQLEAIKNRFGFAHQESLGVETAGAQRAIMRAESDLGRPLTKEEGAMVGKGMTPDALAQLGKSIDTSPLKVGKEVAASIQNAQLKVRIENLSELAPLINAGPAPGNIPRPPM